jgi:TP901-1 family phage major tail protein
MAMNGTDLLLLVNTGTPETPTYEVAGSQRDATLEETTDTIDVSSKDSRAMRVLPGRYSGSISLDALYVPTDAAYLALRTANRDGELILVARQEDGVVTETVTAKIDSISEAFPNQDAATISVALTIDGFWAEVGS